MRVPSVYFQNLAAQQPLLLYPSNVFVHTIIQFGVIPLGYQFINLFGKHIYLLQLQAYFLFLSLRLRSVYLLQSNLAIFQVFNPPANILGSELKSEANLLICSFLALY